MVKCKDIRVEIHTGESTKSKTLQASLRAEFMLSDFSATAAQSLLEKILLLNILFMIISQKKGYNAGLNFHKQ